MARGDSGRWVTRAASTGGGRSYRGQRPVKWYLSLFFIVVLGIVSVVYSRYERQHPVAAAQPAVGTKSYSALAFDVCGTTAADLPANPNQASAAPEIQTQGDGVIYTEPTKSAYAGTNATLARFVSLYPGLELTSSKLRLPGKLTLTDGYKCPTGSPDQGRPGNVVIDVWSSFSGSGAEHPVTYTDPTAVHLANGQLISVAFVPTGSSVPKPNSQTITTLLNLIEAGASSTSTTLAVTAPTTVTPTTVSPTTVTPTTVATKPSPTTTPSTTVPK
jgi:hypothetical protein